MMPEALSPLIPPIVFAVSALLLTAGTRVGDLWVRRATAAATAPAAAVAAVYALALALTEGALLSVGVGLLALPVSWPGVVLAVIVKGTAHYLTTAATAVPVAAGAGLARPPLAPSAPGQAGPVWQHTWALLGAMIVALTAA